MSDWRSRAVPTDPMAASRAAVINSGQPQVQGWPGTVPPEQSPAPTPAISDWRSRAVPTAQATPTQGAGGAETSIQPKEPSLGEDLQAAYAQRDANIQANADKVVAGKLNPDVAELSNAMENASKLPDTVGIGIAHLPVVGPALRAVGGAVSHAIAPETKQFVSDKLDQFSNAYPNTASLLKTGGQAANIAIAGSGVTQLGNKLPLAGRTMGETAPKVIPKTASEKLGAAATENYDTANFLGQKYGASQVGNPFAQAVRDATPKTNANGIYTSEQQALANHLKEFRGFKGKAMTLDQVDALDQSLSDKIFNEMRPDGSYSSNGRELMLLQKKLRQIVNSVPDSPGNDALNNGRNFYAAKMRVRDIENIYRNAKVAGGDEAKALEAGFRALYRDPEVQATWPKETLPLLAEAATPGKAAKLFGPLMAKMTSYVALGSGNVMGAAGAHGLNLAERGMALRAAVKRGAKVQNSLIEGALRKEKPVTVGAPEYPPQPLLPPPNKMSALPISDRQVNIARKLMSTRRTGVTEGEGVAITPVNPVLKAQALKGSKAQRYQVIKTNFERGAISQNEFSRQMAELGFNTQQARSLAKDLKVQTQKGQK